MIEEDVRADIGQVFAPDGAAHADEEGGDGEGDRLVEARVDAGALRLHLVLADGAQMQAELRVLDAVGGVDGERRDDEEGVVIGELDPLRVQVELRQRHAVRAADEAPVVEEDARHHQQRDRRDDEGRPAHPERDQADQEARSRRRPGRRAAR